MLKERPLRAWSTVLLLLVALTAGCRHYVRGQPIAEHGFTPKDDAFTAPPGVAALHYYGVGGWGIRWKSTYLITAPYFSNHDYLASSVQDAVPRKAEIAKGFDGTPYRETSVILVGHGHVDHASDIPAYPFKEMNGGKPPTLIADQSTINMLGESTLAQVCAVPLDTDGAIDGSCPTGDVRIQALPWAHAPHSSVGVFYVTVGDPFGFQSTPRDEPPAEGGEWLVGRTWAYLIDLMDKGKAVFRILYVDAAANPRFSETDIPGRAVDVHIACVPGYDLVEGYPTAVIEHYDVKYVLAGHWENFFQDRDDSLEPVPIALDDDKMDAFVSLVDLAIGAPMKGNGPINKDGCEKCGPHDDNWAVPIPGETFWFRTAK